MKKIQVKDKFREQLEVNKLIKEYLYKGGKIKTVPKVEREAAWMIEFIIMIALCITAIIVIGKILIWPQRCM